MARGRPTRPYKTSWGKTIDGLYKLPDGRWRITEGLHKGERFTEPNERIAVARFLAMQPEAPVVTIPIEGTTTTSQEIDDDFKRAMNDPEFLLNDPVPVSLKPRGPFKKNAVDITHF